MSRHWHRRCVCVVGRHVYEILKCFYFVVEEVVICIVRSCFPLLGCLLSLPLCAVAQQAPYQPYAAQSVASNDVAFSSSAELPEAPSALLADRAADAQTAPQDDAAARKARAAAQLKKEESQRVAGIIPTFNGVLDGQAEPLTRRQKFHLFFKSAFDPYQFALAGIDTAIQEGEDSYPDYHHGIPGLLRNYGASFGDSFDGNFWGNAVLPSLLHQDPRYFRLGHGSILHRALYSASTTIRAKNDNGHWQPNYSNVLGNIIGGAISNFYYPDSERGVELTFERAFTVTAEGTFGAELIEFYPDVTEHFKRAHQRKLARKAAAAQAEAEAAKQKAEAAQQAAPQQPAPQAPPQS